MVNIVAKGDAAAAQGSFIIVAMPAIHDVARIRYDNAMLLFDEFVRAQVKHPEAATLRGLEGRFARRLQIQASYWSQIKSGSRQIGERLARQFERLCHKPQGWMDLPREAAAFEVPVADDGTPRTDDERFVVSLVLSYYRRHPERARARLLQLLGEALTAKPAEAGQAAGPPRDAPAGGQRRPGLPGRRRQS
jgi:hypothetical protein